MRTDKKSDEYEARYQLAVRTITHLKNGIHSIFTRIGTSTSRIYSCLTLPYVQPAPRSVVIIVTISQSI